MGKYKYWSYNPIGTFKCTKVYDETEFEFTFTNLDENDYVIKGTLELEEYANDDIVKFTGVTIKSILVKIENIEEFTEDTIRGYHYFGKIF